MSYKISMEELDNSLQDKINRVETHKHGLLHTSMATMINSTTGGWNLIDPGISGGGYLLKSIRTEANAPAWLQNNYSSGIAFGGGDTKGVISLSYSAPSLRFAAGNGTEPKWYLTITGSSNKSYNLDNMSEKTHTHTWDSISGKPSTFTPATHTHDYAATNHTHSNYAASNHTHGNATTTTAGFMSKEDKAKLDGLSAGANVTVINNTLTSTSTTEALSAAQGKVLNDKFSGYSPTSHTHTWSSITNKPTSFTPASHAHNISDINNLQNTLNGLQTKINKSLNSVNINSQRGEFVMGVSDGGQTTYGTFPTGGWVHVFGNDCDHFLYQMGMSLDTAGHNKLYYRGKYTSTENWKNWAKIYTSIDKPTLSEIGIQEVASGSNANTLIETGIYKTANWAGTLPSGIADKQGIIVVHNYTGSGSRFWVKQTFISPHQNHIYTRFSSGGTWYGWTKEVLEGDITLSSLGAAASNHTHSNYASSSHSHTWDSITNKPTTFAPSAHTHDYAPYTHYHEQYIPNTGGTINGLSKFYQGDGFVEPSGDYVLKVMQGIDSSTRHGLFCSCRWGTNDSKAIKISSMWNSGLKERELFWVGGAGTVWADNLTVANKIISSNIDIIAEINKLKEQLGGGVLKAEYIYTKGTLAKTGQTHSDSGYSGYVLFDRYGSVTVDGVSPYLDHFIDSRSEYSDGSLRHCTYKVPFKNSFSVSYSSSYYNYPDTITYTIVRNS